MGYSLPDVDAISTSLFEVSGRKKLYSVRPEACYNVLRDQLCSHETAHGRGDLQSKAAAFLVRYLFADRQRQRSLRMTHLGQIRDILHGKGGTVWTISPEATVLDAIQMMAEKNVGALLVTKDEKLIGIISERDYSRKVVLKGRASKDTPVRDVLSGHVVHVSPDHSVDECMRLMTEHRVRHLPVLDGSKVVGVVSIGDLVNWIISAQSSTIQQLETYITGYPTPPV
jgi:CBS domain-containing protein